MPQFTAAAGTSREQPCGAYDVHAVPLPVRTHVGDTSRRTRLARLRTRARIHARALTRLRGGRLRRNSVRRLLSHHDVGVPPHQVLRQALQRWVTEKDVRQHGDAETFGQHTRVLGK